MEEELSNLSTFDIYTDLFLEQHQTSNVQVAVEQVEKANAEFKAKLEELTQQLQSLRTQNAVLLEENKILKINISQLFKTAQAELQRKDRQLEELANRGPRYHQEIDYKSSINDRLRDLRKHPRGYPTRTNGIERDVSSDASDRQVSGVLAKKPCEQDQVATSSKEGRHHQLGSGTSAPKWIASVEKPRDVHHNQIEETVSVKRDLSKNSEKFCTHSESQSKNVESRSKDSDKFYQEKIPNRQSMSRYRIPKKSKIREDSDEGRSSEPGVSCTRDTKASYHRSAASPVRYTKNKDAPQRKSSHSPRQGHYRRSRSKSRERSSRYSDRSTVRSGLEQCSQRKRRHSPDERVSGYHSHRNAPHKKHRGEFVTKSHDGRHRDSSGSPKKSRLQTSRNSGSPVKEEAIRKAERKSHSLNTSSHQKATDKAEKSAEVDDRTRKRHQSDRKNKSLKRAKETLHKLHSTPKKHRRQDKDEYRKHKHSKHHHSMRDKRNSGDGKTSSTVYCASTRKLIEELEEGEMQDGDFEDKCEGFTAEKIEEDCTNEEGQDLQNTRDKAEKAAEVDDRTRKRHQSDRKNRSLKRAKDTLHKLHSTPKKHRRQDKDEYRKHKHSKHHHSKRDKRNSGDGKTSSTVYCASTRKSIEELEEGEMQEGDFEDKCEGFTAEKSQEDCTNEEGQDLHSESAQSDLVRLTFSQTEVNKEPSEQHFNKNIESSTCAVEPELAHKGTDQEMFVPSDKEPVLLAVITAHDCVEGETNQERQFSESERELTGGVSTEQCRETCKSRESQTNSNNGNIYNNRKEIRKDGVESDDTGVKADKIQSKDMLSKRQPETESYGYSSEHEIVLFCAPSSQDEVLGSEIDNESTSSSYSVSDAVFHNETVECLLEKEGSDLILQGQSVISEEGIAFQDGKGLRIDTSDNQSQPEDVIKSEPNKADLFHLETEGAQSEPTSKSQGSLKTAPSDLLKPALSPVGNTTDSFSERILEVFGSNSFLQSDDAEGSREGKTSFTKPESSSFQFEGSKPCCLQGNNSEVLEDCILATDIESNQVSFHKIQSTAPESNSTETEMSSNSEEYKQAGRENNKEGSGGSFNILKEDPLRHHSEEVLLSSDKNELMGTGPKNQGSSTSEIHTECKQHLAWIPLVDQALDSSPTVSMDKVAPYCFEAITQDIANCVTDSEKNPKDPTESKLTDSSASHICLPEADFVGDISINPPSFDALSCSASPAHYSLLGDSDNSYQSNHDEQDEHYENDNIKGDSERSDGDDPSNQDANSETMENLEHGTASNLRSLSDGEIISNSESEDEPDLKMSTQKLDVNMTPIPKTSESSRNRSRSRDRKRHRSKGKQPLSHKSRSYPIKHSKDERSKGRDRDEFFKKKMRILEDRLRAQDEAEQKLSSRSKRDRPHDSYSASRSREETKKLKSIVHKGTDLSQRTSSSGQDDKRYSSRHLNQRQDTDKHKSTGRKSERGKVEDKERHKRRHHKR